MTRAYGTLTLADGRWAMRADPHVALRAKRVFGRLSLTAQGTLVLSHTPEVCRDLAWFLERYPLTLTAEDAQALTAGATQHREQIATLEALVDPSYEPPAFALAVPPRSYQAREAAMWLARGGLLNGDDVGLGKTASAICGFVDGRTLPAAVVTLSHLPRQWEAELGKFAPDLHVHVVRKGQPYPLPQWFGHGPDVLVLTYHKLAGWHDVLASYCRSIVFDEVQELRHRDTKRYAAAAHVATRVPFRLGLSATPIHNYGGEIFNILDVLAPGALGTFEEFATEWCTGRDPRTMLLRDPRAFGSWLREQHLLVRHTRADVARELPPVLRIPQIIPSDTEALSRVHAQATELAQIILATQPLEAGTQWQASEQLTILLRQATGIAKAPYVADFVRLLVSQGERVVLCGWHREVYDIWRAKLADVTPRMYTGSETADQKAAAKQAFVDGETPVLILSLRSGAGLDGLQAVSSCIVFGELDWSPAVHEQAIGRVHRDGQDGPVSAYFLMAESGSDPTIAENLGLKRAQLDGIRNPAGGFLEQTDRSGDRVRTLATAYLAQVGAARSAPVAS